MKKKLQAILMHTVFSSVNASKECLVPSRPLPDSFIPPNGISRLLKQAKDIMTVVFKRG
jgi:hypothetical protein